MRKLLFLVIVLLAPFGARAASFQVNPIRLTLSAAQSTDVLRVANNSDSPTVVQLQIVAWAQEHNADVYTPSRALLATPPIFTIEPGSLQVVRIGMRSAPDTKQETCYRLFLSEVPPAPKPGFRGVQIALRVGIPVFVEPAVATAPTLQWAAKRLSADALQITAVNTGNAHVEILKLKVNAPGHGTPLVQEFGGYVLPGAQRAWTLKVAAPLAANAPLEITADTDRGSFHAQVSPGA
ncbi:MAG: molecular chaperone [Gammaproteobacteria bacterium]|nr:molecular chaperone [Gammaproteobacteria bacterium]MDE2461453.1 molecular chaperone [Gammaproteobacteria bacterium]